MTATQLENADDLNLRCSQWKGENTSLRCDSQAEKLLVIPESHNPHAGTILSQWNGPLGLWRVENDIERDVDRDGKWKGLFTLWVD